MPAAGPLGPSDSVGDGTSGTPSPAAPATSADGGDRDRLRLGAARQSGGPQHRYATEGGAERRHGHDGDRQTNRGSISIALDRALTPCTVASFAYLAGRHFFDETPCHRLTTSGIFILQCGDPTGTGTGGPSYTIPDEALPLSATATVKYPRGTVAMANTGLPNTGGSQFFLVYKDSVLPPTFAVFGTITDGEDILDVVADGGVGTNPAGSTVDGPPELPLTILGVNIITP